MLNTADAWLIHATSPLSHESFCHIRCTARCPSVAGGVSSAWSESPISVEGLRGPAQPVYRGEGPKGFSYFVLCAPYFIEGLQIHPELCARAEEVGESNRGVSGDRAAPVEDLGNAVRRYVQMSSQACGAES